jgi:hypothetical protein
MAFMTPSENFFNRDGAGLFAEFREVLDCAIDLFLSNARLGHDPRDGLPVPGNDDGLAAFYLVE